MQAEIIADAGSFMDDDAAVMIDMQPFPYGIMINIDAQPGSFYILPASAPGIAQSVSGIKVVLAEPEVFLIVPDLVFRRAEQMHSEQRNRAVWEIKSLFAIQIFIQCTSTIDHSGKTAGTIWQIQPAVGRILLPGGYGK